MNDNAGAVLVVDDSKDLVRVLQVVLSRAGYRVLTALSGEAAVQVLESDPGEILLALVDVRMPGMDGPTTVRQLHSLRPGLPCVLMTGYAGSCTAESLQGTGAQAILTKPFPLDEVVFMVRELTNRGACSKGSVPCGGDHLPTDRRECS
jgi:CheY-like chemotaxis protein